MKNKLWYMDCYCYGAMCGKEFPVNSYKSYSLFHILSRSKNILESEITGIDEIRITKESKGQGPIFLEE